MQFLIVSRKNCAITYEKRQGNKDGITVILLLHKFFLIYC